VSYTTKTMREFGQEIAAVSESKGWTVPSSVGETERMLSKLMLVTTEVAEAAEAVRTGDAENFAEELADTVIRVLHIAHGCGINMDREVEKKIATNRQRDFAHGGKRA
jgi:NTP pyrophosphatase (non-canonical NTP hydrolase)